MWKLTISVFAETEEKAEDFAVKLCDKAQEMWEELPGTDVCMNTSLVQKVPKVMETSQESSDAAR